MPAGSLPVAREAALPVGMLPVVELPVGSLREAREAALPVGSLWEAELPVAQLPEELLREAGLPVGSLREAREAAGFPLRVCHHQTRGATPLGLLSWRAIQCQSPRAAAHNPLRLRRAAASSLFSPPCS